MNDIAQGIDPEQYYYEKLQREKMNELNKEVIMEIIQVRSLIFDLL